MRTARDTNFSCPMDPDDRKMLRIIKENTGLQWVPFFSHLVEILGGVKNLDDFMEIKQKMKEVTSYGKK